MSNKRIINCPFCQQELDTNNYYVRCHNPRCDTTAEMEGTEEIWAALVRTREALDVAKEALNDIQFADDRNKIAYIRSFAHNALGQVEKRYWNQEE